jgi:hypothetical protein
MEKHDAGTIAPVIILPSPPTGRREPW